MLLIFGILAVYIVGCSSLEEDAAFVSVNPPIGNRITPGSVITVTFDNTPLAADVELQGFPDTSFWWELDNKTLTVGGNPEFRVGKDYTIIITWATGRKILNYSVPVPPKPPRLEPPPANFVSAIPPGGAIAANGTITVTFDNAPTDVTVSAGTVTVVGKTAIVSGPFTPGPLALTVGWADGAQALNYTVIARGTIPPRGPRVIGGTVRDGDKNVDAEAINRAAKIEIIFSELVVGNIALQTEGGDDIGWLGRVQGNKGTLELVKGKEIGDGNIYVIAGKVSDAAGNEAEVRITFVTKR